MTRVCTECQRSMIINNRVSDGILKNVKTEYTYSCSKCLNDKGIIYFLCDECYEIEKDDHECGKECLIREVNKSTGEPMLDMTLRK